MPNVDPTLLAQLFHALVHVVLAAAALLQLLLIYVVIAKFRAERGWQETIMRSAAAVAGLLIYLGSKTLGLSIPAFLLAALGERASYLTGIFGALLPALTGLLVAAYVCRFLNSREERKSTVGMRILAMIMTITFFLYTDCYAASLDASQDGIQLLLPNVSFVLATLLFAIFRYQPLPDPTEPSPPLHYADRVEPR